MVKINEINKDIKLKIATAHSEEKCNNVLCKPFQHLKA